MKKIAVLGSTGRLGHMVVSELLEKAGDVRIVLAGRDRLHMERISMDLGRRFKQAVDVTKVDFNDRQGMRVLCDQSDVLINCVGPYSLSGAAAMATSVAGKSHLLDACTEPTFFEQCAMRDAGIEEAGILIVNGLGLYGGVADLAASIAAKGWKPVNSVDVLYMVTDLEEGPGSRQSYLEILKQPVRSFVDRRVMPVALGSAKKTFKWPGGEGKGLLTGGGEVFHLPRHLSGIRGVRVFRQTKGMMASVPSMLKVWASLPTTQKWAKEPSTSSTDSSRFAVIVEMEAADSRRFAVVQGTGVYTITARLLARAALKLANEGARALGVQAPSTAFEADWLAKQVGLEVQVADAPKEG